MYTTYKNVIRLYIDRLYYDRVAHQTNITGITCYNYKSLGRWVRSMKDKIVNDNDFSERMYLVVNGRSVVDEINLNKLIADKKDAGDTKRLRVYVDPLCTTSRDVIRNTYEISRTKENADVIVIPSPFNNYEDEHLANAIFVTFANGDKMFMLVSCSSNCSYLYNDDCMRLNDILKDNEQTIKDYLLREFGEVVVDIKYIANKNVQFLKPCDNYLDILNKYTLPDKLYIVENRLPLEPISTVTPDSLYIMWYCDDKEIFNKMILASDWRRYPILTYLMIDMKRRKKSWNYKSSEMSRAFEAVCGFCQAKYDNGLVSGEELNMIQDFILKICGITDRGFANQKTWNELVTYGFGKFMPMRIAIQKTSFKDDEQISFYNGIS